MNFYLTREAIRDGDVLLYEGCTLISWFIKRVTQSRYSHTGIAVWWNERLMVMEAVGRGVIITPLSLNISHYQGHVHWFSSRRKIPAADRKRMIIFAQEELGKKYARFRAFWVGVKLLLRWKREERDELRHEQKLFCSSYVAQIYNAIDIDLVPGISDLHTTPEDIARSPELIKRGVLKLTAGIVPEKRAP